jgi:hypothetical protein
LKIASKDINVNTVAVTRKVSDMYLAAALLSYGTKFVGVNREDRSRQKFEFEGEVPNVVVASDDVQLTALKNIPIEQFETHFLSRRVWLPPSYPDCVRQIKSAIHSG